MFFKVSQTTVWTSIKKNQMFLVSIYCGRILNRENDNRIVALYHPPLQSERHPGRGNRKWLSLVKHCSINRQRNAA